MNRIRIGLVLASALCAATASISAQAPRAATPPTDAGVQRVTSLVQELKARKTQKNLPSKTYVVSESDLNAYLAAQLKERKRRDLQSMVVRLGKGTFTAFVTVDLNQVDASGASTAMSLLRRLLGGRQSLAIEGSLSGDKGQGVMTLDRARVNRLPLPTSLLGAVLSAVGRRQRDPFYLDDPFPLPYGLKRIRIEPGKATIQT
jgi:hypothetical protein